MQAKKRLLIINRTFQSRKRSLRRMNPMKGRKKRTRMARMTKAMKKALSDQGFTSK